MRFIASVILAGVLALESSALAQVQVGIASPTHGATITTTAFFYHAATETITVGGAVTGLTTTAGYYVLVQGIYATLVPAGPPNSGRYTFQVEVPVGPHPPPMFGGRWPSWFPYVSAYSDPNHILKPVIAEVYDLKQNTVVDRARVVVYDARTDPSFHAHFTGAGISNSLSMEMAYTGLDKLEGMHAATMPLPSQAAFNSALTSRFTGVPVNVYPDTSITSNAKACIPLDQADPAFRQTSAYTNGASLTANFLYQEYLEAQQTVQTGSGVGIFAVWPPALLIGGSITLTAQTVMNNICVKTPVNAADFELCAGTMTGTAQDLTLEQVTSTDLQIGSSHPIESKVQLGRLNGTIDGKMRDLFIRYRRNATPVPPLPGSCIIRPQNSISNSTVAADQAMVRWTLCNDMEADAASAHTQNFLPFTFGADTSNTERNLIQAGFAPPPLFTLGAHATNPDKGQCANSIFRPYAQNLLDQFWGRMQTAVDGAWNQGNPTTQQASDLDQLFSRWEPGIWGDQLQNDYTLKLNFNQTGYIAADRLYENLDSDAKRNGGPSPTEWTYSSPGPFPCRDPLSPCIIGRSFFQAPFDIAYSVTTGALNQVLRELYTTRWLEFELRPSYNDLGIAPPPGAAGTDRPTLDGFLLQSFNPAFAPLGPTTVRILLRPTMMPFTWINPDPPNPPPPQPPIQAGRAPLTYNLGQFYVDFIGNQPGPKGGTLWLRVLVDFYDGQFNLSLSPSPSFNVLEPAMSGTGGFNYTILESQFLNCGIAPMTLPATPPNPPYPTCGGSLTASVSTLVTSVLNANLLGMLSRYPAPERYDVMGRAPVPRTLNQLDKYQWQQVITFYAGLQ